MLQSKRRAQNDIVSEQLERVMEGRVCADTGVMLCHCRWAGFTPADDTWEPRENIQGYPEFLKFRRNVKDKEETVHNTKAPKQAKSGQPQTSKKCTKTNNGTSTIGGQNQATLHLDVGQPEAKVPVSSLQEGMKTWVEHNDVHGELKWFKAKVVIVSPTSEVPSASVVRVHLLDGQKSNLNLMCPPDSDKLENRNPKKYEQFDWSTKPAYSDNWQFMVD